MTQPTTRNCFVSDIIGICQAAVLFSTLTTNTPLLLPHHRQLHYIKVRTSKAGRLMPYSYERQKLRQGKKSTHSNYKYELRACTQPNEYAYPYVWRLQLLGSVRRPFFFLVWWHLQTN